jgi:hypothetical protein
MKARFAPPSLSQRFRTVIDPTTEAAETDNKALIPGPYPSLEGRAAARGLNAFFANSVNSPSMSMVNVPCCVRSVPDVTREVTAQPTRSAA